MNRVVASLDGYGQAPKFLYNVQSVCKTAWGGYITILLICYQAFCLGFIIYRYFERGSSETNINRQYKPDPKGFTLTKDTMPFAFGIEDSNSKYYIDFSIYTVRAVYGLKKTIITNGVENTTFINTELSVVPCREVGLDPTYFSNIPLDTTLCLKEFINPTTNMKITGEWESPEFGYVQIIISPCTGSSCKPESEIFNKLKKGTLAINYLNYALQSSNYENPAIKFPAKYFTTFSTDYSKNIELRLTDTEILTQDSLFGYVRPDSYNFTRVETVTDRITQLNQNTSALPTNMINFIFRMDQLKFSVSRVYKTSFQYMAELGGMLNITVIFTLLITNRLTSVLLYIDMVKKKFFSRGVAGSRKDSEVMGELEKKAAIKQEEGLNIVSSPMVRTPSPLKKSKLMKNVIKSKTSQIVGRNLKQDNMKESDSKSHISNTNPNQMGFVASSVYLKQDEVEKDWPLVQPSPEKNETGKKEENKDWDIDRMVMVSTKNHERRIQKANLSMDMVKSITAKHILLKAFFPFFVNDDSSISKVIAQGKEGQKDSLDYFAVMNLIEEFKILKALLLTKDQLNLFEFLDLDDVIRSKESISIRNDMQSYQPNTRDQSDPPKYQFDVEKVDPVTLIPKKIGDSISKETRFKPGLIDDKSPATSTKRTKTQFNNGSQLVRTSLRSGNLELPPRRDPKEEIDSLIAQYNGGVIDRIYIECVGYLSSYNKH